VGSTLAAATAALVTLLIAASASGGPGDALPDIVPDAPSGDFLQTYVDTDGTSRLLLRFNGYVHNAGVGALELRGTDNSDGVMASVSQRIFSADGASSRDVATSGQIRYETADGHGHFHLRAAMQYGLFEETRTTLAAPAMKVGFCLVDSQQISGSVPKGYPLGTNCEKGTPNAPTVVMGVSPGWRDIYPWNLAFQWVDVSDVAPGTYWLAARVDPHSVMLEASESNNDWAFKSSQSVVPGWVAQSSSVTVPTGTPTTIPLSGRSFGQPGAIRWEIVSGPQLGSLDRLAGVPFEQSSVIYTPRPGATGVDTFWIRARDSLSSFPRFPAQAMVTVTINGPVPSIVISGAPAFLYTGTGAQLTATVTGTSSSVSWSVDGAPGGNATSGTITPSGLYTAPASVPPAGTVTVRAASANASADVAIAIQAPPPPTPAPSPTPPAPPTPPPPPSSGSAPLPSPAPPLVAKVPPETKVASTKSIRANPLSVPALSARGRLLLVGLKSTRAGTLRFQVLRGGTRLGGCVVRTPGRSSVTCAVTIRRGVALLGIRVRIGLHANGKLVATRVARVTGVATASTDGLRTLYCKLG
jgi:hypothetical protein